jgi:hypothetical protein
MAYLDEVATAIEAGTTEAGTGSSYPIFRGHLPDSTVLGDRAVALIMSAGFNDEARVEIDNPGLQVITRGAPINSVSTGYEEAEAVAWLVKNALHEYTGTPESTGLYYVGIWNESGPFFIGFDENYRPMFSNNLRVLRSRT